MSIDDLINDWAEDSNIEFPPDAREKALGYLVEMVREGKSPIIIYREMKALGYSLDDIDTLMTS